MFYYFFVLLFIVASPIILLYAVGYKVDFTNRTVQQTGMILLDVVPNDALILVNSASITDDNRSKGVVRLAGLATGLYRVEITKDGYEQWQTTLTVNVGFIAAPPTIRLVRKTQAFMTLPITIHATAVSPTADTVAVVITRQGIPTIIFISTSDGTTTKTVPITGLSGTTEQLLWSADGQNIALVNKQASGNIGVVYDRARGILSRPVTLRAITRWENDSQRLLTTDGKQVSWIYPFAQQILTRSTSPEIRIQDILPIAGQDLALIKTPSGVQLAEIKPPSEATQLSTTIVLPKTIFPTGSSILGRLGAWVLIKTPTLVLILTFENDQWKIQQEIPAAAAAVISRDTLYTVDSRILYSWDGGAAGIRQRPYALPDPPTLLASIPEMPWVAIATKNGLWLHQRPSRPFESGLPEQTAIALESELNIDSLVASPNGRFILLSGTKGSESGLFLRLLSDASGTLFSGGR